MENLAGVMMCHAPIVIPEIGGDRAQDCLMSTKGMRKVAQHVVAEKPDEILVLSPHAPRSREGVCFYNDSEIRGTFAPFGFDEVGVAFPQGGAGKVWAEYGCPEKLIPLKGYDLDHGALVPLFFLQEAGWAGPTSVIGISGDPQPQANKAMGLSLREFAAQSSGKVMVVASGDMSHRLQPAAPAGFHPEAYKFDEALVECIKSQNYRRIPRFDPALRELAAEDAVDTLSIALEALRYQTEGAEYISYEAPFGVGYMTAILNIFSMKEGPADG